MVSYELSFSAGSPAGGPYPTMRTVQASAVTPCADNKIGVTLGSLGLPDHPSYRAVARALDASGNRSVNYSAEAIPTPFPLDATPPGDVGGLSVQGAAP